MSLLTSAVSMTKAMVRIDSTDPGTYEKAMADWIEQQLSDLPNVIITRKEILPGRPNLMAEISGPGELPALVMICRPGLLPVRFYHGCQNTPDFWPDSKKEPQTHLFHG